MHGCGQRKFVNGDTYVGKYNQGQRSGGPKWKLKFSNGDLYVGGWEADQFHGPGRYFYANGTVLEGDFSHGVKQGKFKRQLPTKELDILRFEDDQLVGQGVRWNAKRTKTWLLSLEPARHGAHANTKSTTTTSGKNNRCRRGIRGIGIVNPIRRKFFRRRAKAVNGSSSSDNLHAEGNNNDTAKTFSSSSSLSSPSPPSSSIPVDNVVPVVAQEIMTNFKKSIRIPISQAVSIGYDCELGTGTRTRAGVGSVSV